MCRRPKKTISTVKMYCMNRYLNQLNEQCLEREVERFANRLMIEMYLREIVILGVQNCLFHEMIISDKTERGSLKLTRCSCRNKVHETENLSARNPEIQSKTYV